MSKSKEVVVGLDFGTSRSGFSFSFVDDPLDYFMFINKWEATNSNYIKTATMILYQNENGIQKPIKWGWEAPKMKSYLLNQSKNKNSSIKVDEKDLTLFKNFKMNLSDELYFSNGTSITPIEVIKDYLVFIKEKVLFEINKNYEKNNKIQVDEIRWCLTIPAIWKDKQKILMRKAAYLAGLIGDKMEVKKFLFAYEPEAAAVYCLLSNIKNAKDNSYLSIGDKFITFDAGGGSIDLTAHIIEDDRTLKELCIGKGGAYGSMCIDESFLDYLKEFVGEKAYEEIEKSDEEFQKILTNFQEIKEENISDPHLICGSIPIPNKFYKIIKKYNQNIDMDEDSPSIELNYNEMEKIYKNTLQNIEDLLKKFFTILENKKIKCTKLLMVGGFSQSYFLQEMIKKNFKDKFQIIIPTFPGECVVKGALIFGKKPELIQTRIMRRTYGIGGYVYFDEKKHKPEKKDIKGDKILCKDIFDVWVRAGDEISSKGQTFLKKYPVVEKNQNTMKITVYSTEMENPMYTDDDPKVEIDLSFTMKFSNPPKEKDRFLNLEITFGLTEVIIKATTDGDPVIFSFDIEGKKKDVKKIGKSEK